MTTEVVLKELHLGALTAVFSGSKAMVPVPAVFLWLLYPDVPSLSREPRDLHFLRSLALIQGFFLGLEGDSS